VHVTGVEIEGVGSFREPRRIELGPGAVLVAGPNESGKSTLLDLLAFLLDPDPALEMAPALRSNPPAERSRAVLEAADSGGVLRIEADFDARGLSLQEDEGPVLESPAAAVAAGLRQRLGLPERGHYARLFTASGERVVPASRGGRRGDAQRALAARAAGRAAEQARAEVDALRARLASAQEHALQHGLRESETEQLRDLEARRDEVRAVRDELAGVEEQLRRTSALAAAPADLEERVADYRRLSEELAAGEERIAARIRALDEERARAAQPSVGRRAALLLGGVLAAGGGALWLLDSLLAPIFLGLGIATLGVAAGRALWVRLVLSRLDEARAAEQDRMRMHRHRFELETVAVRSLATALGLDSPADLDDAIVTHRRTVERRDVLRAELAALGDPAELEGEIRAVKARLRALPEPPPASGGAGEAESAALRARLEAAERELRLAERAAHEAAAAASAEEVAPSAWMVEGLVWAAATFQEREPDAAWADAERLVGAYVRALSDARYAAVRRKGEARFLLEREGRSPLALEDATGTAAEVLHHAVQLALVERTALARPLPLLLDDPFARLDARRRVGAARCVRRLGAVTQVVLASSDALFRRAADRVVEL